MKNLLDWEPPDLRLARLRLELSCLEVNLARAASKTPSNRWVLATQGIVLQADLGLFKEALNALNPGPGTIATGGGPQIGRRMVRRLGTEAAVEQVRKLGIREVSNLVLLGIAQEMARPGVGDSEWSFSER